jgi:hypothetical protein
MGVINDQRFRDDLDYLIRTVNEELRQSALDESSGTLLENVLDLNYDLPTEVHEERHRRSFHQFRDARISGAIDDIVEVLQSEVVYPLSRLADPYDTPIETMRRRLEEWRGEAGSPADIFVNVYLTELQNALIDMHHVAASLKAILEAHRDIVKVARHSVLGIANQTLARLDAADKQRDMEDAEDLAALAMAIVEGLGATAAQGPAEGVITGLTKVGTHLAANAFEVRGDSVAEIQASMETQIGQLAQNVHDEEVELFNALRHLEQYVETPGRRREGLHRENLLPPDVNPPTRLTPTRPSPSRY